jgi:type IX secretion system PorP/SprF family membrane protein
MKVYVLFVFLLAAPLLASAQYFQYSQYNFTDQRINPAMVASSDHASVGFIFRNQNTGAPDIRLKSSMVSAAYPFLNRRSGKRWSGLGVSLMDDRSGGIFSLQEASLSYALNVFLSRFQSLSLGFKGLYQKRSVDLTGLFTGSQYVADRGFDFSRSNGENMGILSSDFATFSAGVYWQGHDRQGRRIAYWGISFFDMNRPQDSFLGIDHQLHSTWVAAGGIRLYHQDNISIYPEVLLTCASTTLLNVGATMSYEIKPYPNQVAGRVDLITKYVPGRSGILGLQFHRESFSLGLSYDIPVGRDNPANTGAIEIALQLKRLVDPSPRKKVASRDNVNGRKEVKPGPSANKPSSGRSKTIPSGKNGADPDSIPSTRSGKQADLKTGLTKKADSVIANARAGRITHEPFVIERLNLHFNFEFNSAELDEPSLKYLDELSEALRENPLIKIKLTGHTDNVGSASFNMRLSVYRANMIGQHLKERGVEASRIQIAGKGLTEPLNENSTEAERAQNRRVELLIYYQDE